MSQSPVPPYAAPPGPPPPPPVPARRRRPSAWWFALGGGLLVAAVVVGVALLVWTLKGFLETDATVVADGRPHAVHVGTDGDRMLWLEDGFGQQCSVVDRATGDPVVAAPVVGSYHRSDGSGDWHGALRFHPGSGDLEVTCTDSDGSVLLGPAPRIAGFVGGVFFAILAPLLLGGMGVVALIVTTVLFATGAPRSQPPAPGRAG